MANRKNKICITANCKYAKAVTLLIFAVSVACLLSFKYKSQTNSSTVEINVLVKNNNLQDTIFLFKDGDILFQDLDCGELCDAIEKVTHGIDGKSFSHIGLVCSRNDSLFVIEAIGKDVHLTLLVNFINRSKDKNGNPKILVGRLKKSFQKLNGSALKYAISQIGVPYDDEFIYDNQKYYCSELIYDAYKYANNDQPFFQLEPMTFKDPSTGKTFAAWEKYYQDLKIAIPEGKRGCNPAGISRSNKIRIVKSFY